MVGLAGVGLAAGGGLLVARRQRDAGGRDEAVAGARRLLDAHNAQGAALLLDGVLMARPRDGEAQLIRGDAAAALHDFNTARNAYIQALQSPAQRAQARARLFDLTFEAGARDEARHHLDKLAEELGPDDRQVTSRRSRLNGAP